MEKNQIQILDDRLLDEWKAYMFYRNASQWCDVNGFNKYAGKSFVYEYHDEASHAHKIERRLTDWGIKPTMPDLTKINYDFKSVLDICQKAHDMESDLLIKYNKSVLKFNNTDPDFALFLKKYVLIQEKSVVKYNSILKQLETVKTDYELHSLEKKIFGKYLKKMR